MNLKSKYVFLFLYSLKLKNVWNLFYIFNLGTDLIHASKNFYTFYHFFDSISDHLVRSIFQPKVCLLI